MLAINPLHGNVFDAQIHRAIAFLSVTVKDYMNYH